MGRSPQDDERDGLVDSLVLKKKALSLRRKGLDSWGIAQALGVSTSTVIQWQAHIYEKLLPALRSEPPPVKKKVGPSKSERDDALSTLAKHLRKQNILRGAGTPRRKRVALNNARYEQRRIMQMNVAGIVPQRHDSDGAFYAAPGMAVGVKIARGTAGDGREIRPKQVPWVHEFE